MTLEVSGNFVRTQGIGFLRRITEILGYFRDFKGKTRTAGGSTRDR